MSTDMAPLHLWISETLDDLLNDLQRIAGQSRSECVPTVHASRRGCWGGRTPALGKNDVDIKLWLDPALRSDLAHLAERAGLTLSHFAREVLITHLLGHTYLPQRTELFVVRSPADSASQQE